MGLDVGGTKILGVAIDATTGAVLSEHRVATPSGAALVLDALAGVVGDVSEQHGGIDAVGIGAAGLVDVDGVLRYGPNLPGVVDLDLRGELGRRVGVPVAVDNDATTALVAEHRIGAARGVDDVVFVALGTGIGGALVLDGRVRRGAHGFAGEFGHMVVDPDGPVCGCGRRGCWEAVASGSALGTMARTRAAAGVAPAILALAGGDASAVRGEHAVAAAEQGDEVALTVLAEYARAVALGVSALVSALDPAMVVMGGGVVEAGQLLMEPLRAAVGERVMGSSHRPEVPIVPARGGNSAAAVGAALLAHDLVEPATTDLPGAGGARE